jgi:hypothetical protein
MTDNKIIPIPIKCGHCANISQMDLLTEAEIDLTEFDPQLGFSYTHIKHYYTLRCPSCFNINFISHDSFDGMDGDDYVNHIVLYPQNSPLPLGLPDKILAAFNASQKVKSIDANAYAILMRRLLEMVCVDKNAKPGTLAEMLKEVAKGLKDFGNIGAHFWLGEITEEEIPIIQALCSAILEYVYSAPYLATEAENKLTAIKQK